MTHAEYPAARFGVLVVCTGNICRSPAGERLLRHLLPPGAGIEVNSAGTYAVVGHAIEPSMARLLTADGVDIWGFAARRLTEKLVAAADLVLTMETGHRTAVVQTLPQALSRTFTLREFAHLVAAHHEATSTAYLGADPATRLRELTAVAAERRARRVGPPCPEPDIDDPYRKGDAAYARAYAAIRTAVDVIAAQASGAPTH
ncbi:MAG: low molecular weight phosphatase family protein [Actinomycetales bacterium]|nr:low molecular weight phosphatase family protein [Candidatus Phosphoribacter baldrii]